VVSAKGSLPSWVVGPCWVAGPRQRSRIAAGAGWVCVATRIGLAVYWLRHRRQNIVDTRRNFTLLHFIDVPRILIIWVNTEWLWGWKAAQPHQRITVSIGNSNPRSARIRSGWRWLPSWAESRSIGANLGVVASFFAVRHLDVH
jgi:hypothetical protein